MHNDNRLLIIDYVDSMKYIMYGLFLRELKVLEPVRSEVFELGGGRWTLRLVLLGGSASAGDDVRRSPHGNLECLHPLYTVTMWSSGSYVQFILGYIRRVRMGQNRSLKMRLRRMRRTPASGST